jgi:hypothetical protein
MAPHGPSRICKPLFRKEMLVGAVGIELKATLKARKLLIPLNAKNAKNSEFAQVRYTAGTRELKMVKCVLESNFKNTGIPAVMSVWIPILRAR